MSIYGSKSLSTNNVLGANTLGSIQNDIDVLDDRVDDAETAIDTLENTVVYLSGTQTITGAKTISGAISSSGVNTWTGKNEFSDGLNEFSGYGTNLELAYNPQIVNINQTLTNMLHSGGITYFFNDVNVQAVTCTNAIINSINFNTWYTSVTSSISTLTTLVTGFAYNAGTDTTTVDNKLTVSGGLLSVSAGGVTCNGDVACNNVITGGEDLNVWMAGVDTSLGGVVTTTGNQTIAGDKSFTGILANNNYVHVVAAANAAQYTRLQHFGTFFNFENMVDAGRFLFEGFDNVGSSISHLLLEYNLATLYTRLIQNVKSITTNVLIGPDALLNNNTGVRNVAIGVNAARVNTSNDNVCIGANTLSVASSASNAFSNVAIGSGAGEYSRGSNNTYLGRLTGQTSADSNTYNKSTAIGWSAIVTGSNQIVLGTATETTRFMGNTKSFGLNYGPNDGSLSYVVSSTIPLGGNFSVSATVSAQKNTLAQYTSATILEYGVYIVNIVGRWNQNSGDFGNDATAFFRIEATCTAGSGTLSPNATTLAKVGIDRFNMAPPTLNATVVYTATSGAACRVLPSYYCKHNGTVGSDDVDWILTYIKVA